MFRPCLYLFKQSQKLQSFWQAFVPVSLYFELMSFLNVVLTAPQLSGEPNLLLSCMQELRKGSWKSWGTESEGVDRHTCDHVNQTNRLFGENRLQVCEERIRPEHSPGGTPAGVDSPGTESPGYGDVWVGQFCPRLSRAIRKNEREGIWPDGVRW